MATYARPGDIIRDLRSGDLIHIITPTLHKSEQDAVWNRPHIPWSTFDLDGVYELVHHSIIDRVLEKYLNNDNK